MYIEWNQLKKIYPSLQHPMSKFPAPFCMTTHTPLPPLELISLVVSEILQGSLTVSTNTPR